MRRHSSSGFSLIEALIVIAISLTLAAIAIPVTVNATKNFRLQAATGALRGAIQSTRFQAIMKGYPYQLVINNTALTYRVYKKVPPATSYSADASAVPIVRLGDVTINQAVTLTFNPSGTVAIASGGLPLSITNGISTKSLNVSGVGNVTVTP